MPNLSEEVRQRIARETAKEAVSQLQIPEYKDDLELFSDKRWQVYYRVENDDTALTIALNPSITKSLFHSSLGNIAWNVVDQLDLLLSNGKNLNLLNIDETEKTDVIYEHTLKIVKNYVAHLPLVIFHSHLQTLNESIISHIKKDVLYKLREHWEELNLPKNYSLVPDNNLLKLIKLSPSNEISLFKYLQSGLDEFDSYRKTAFSDRKAWLNEQRRETLPEDYEKLRKLYKEARKEYKDREAAYFKLNRRASYDDWNLFWEQACLEDFPDIFLPNEINNYEPSQLAYKQLGDVFGLSMSRMEKIVRAAKYKRKRQTKKSG